MERKICKTFGEDCKMALGISQAENGTRQCDRQGGRNSNGTYDYGLFQINEIHAPSKGTVEDFKDCDKNIKVALQIFKKQGWSPWSVYKNRTYIKYLSN